jgi:hypothetical protein
MGIFAFYEAQTQFTWMYSLAFFIDFYFVGTVQSTDSIGFVHVINKKMIFGKKLLMYQIGYF